MPARLDPDRILSKAPPLNDQPLLHTQRSYVTASIDHRGERYRHKRVLDALNVQTRQGIPVRRSLARLRAEAQRIVDHKIRLTDDEAKILVAALAECQLRLVLEAELELAAGLYWNAIFWQVRQSRVSGFWVSRTESNRIERNADGTPHASPHPRRRQNQIKSPFSAWLEAGPFTWFMDEEEALSPEDKLDALQRLLNQVSVGTGALGRKQVMDVRGRCCMGCDFGTDRRFGHRQRRQSRQASCSST